MNKGELVASMADHSKTSKADAERSLNCVIDCIISALKKGHDVNLVGFGSFNVQKRNAREGRNPKTGQKMQIAAYKQPVFKAGKKMKDACNS
jgi:DNA-binding protein HU-beta